MYRDGDYDKDDDHKSTASYPEGLREEYRYLPNLFHVTRRTSSMDNLAKFERYFGLVQKNCGRSFQWRHYARILHDGLRRFKTPTLPKRVRSTPLSEVSVYFTASEAAVVTPGVRITPKRSFRRLVSGYISGEGSPSTSSASVKSQLKKVCEETKSLARDIRLKVDKITKMQPKCKTYETRSKKHSARTLRDTPSKYRISQSNVDVTRCGAGDIVKQKRPSTSDAYRCKN